MDYRIDQIDGEGFVTTTATITGCEFKSSGTAHESMTKQIKIEFLAKRVNELELAVSVLSIAVVGLIISVIILTINKG